MGFQVMAFCTVRTFFKQRGATLIYTGLKLCEVFFEIPGMIEKQKKQKKGFMWMSEKLQGNKDNNQIIATLDK